MRYIVIFIHSVAVLCALLVLPINADDEKKIGIFLFSEETRYTLAEKGIMDKLKEEGYEAPRTRFIVENAEYNKATASDLVKKFLTSNMDIIFTIGTSATVPIVREIKGTPVIFAVIYDPVAAGIAKDWKNSGNNTTGASSMVPMSRILDRLKQLKSIKRLAVLYTPDEINSVLVLKDLRQLQSLYRIKVVPVPLSEKEEISQILPEVIRTSDALYVTGSNLVDSQVSMIVNLATKAKVVTITHLEDLVQKGVLMGVCADPYQIGRLAGEKAIKILRGQKPSSIPIETSKKYKIIVNMKTLRAGQFQITQDFLAGVTDKIE